MATARFLHGAADRWLCDVRQGVWNALDWLGF